MSLPGTIGATRRPGTEADFTLAGDGKVSPTQCTQKVSNDMNIVQEQGLAAGTSLDALMKALATSPILTGENSDLIKSTFRSRVRQRPV
jgi:hypothetical protein